MNHRKAEHPSNKRCRYYLKCECIYDGETYWYIHKVQKTESIEEKSITEHACTNCDLKFQIKAELMKHKKSEHRGNVMKCRDFLQGNCRLPEKSCWFIHEIPLDKMDNLEPEPEPEPENESAATNQGFHMDHEKMPPDQLNMIMSLINKLSLQVQTLEKSLKSQ
jgi:hypothetical protein